LRVIGYANSGDFATMWPSRPAGLRVIGAGYGVNPNLPGQIGHQYTNGQVGASPPQLPSGCPPFGNCDMNSADGLSPQQLAAACGIGGTMDPDQLILDQLGGPGTGAGAVDGVTKMWQGWPQLGNLPIVNALAVIGEALKLPGFGLQYANPPITWPAASDAHGGAA
jgi:hypothetical protein